MVAKIIEKMVLYFSSDVRRINHALKVYAFAKTIAGLERISREELLITELAAVLHDIGIKESERKYGSSAARYQELEGPPVAAELLKAVGAEEEVIQRVCHLIGNHHTYGKIDGIDFQILVEADFLVNIFEDGMDRNTVMKIREKYFSTNIGVTLIESMYLKE